MSPSLSIIIVNWNTRHQLKDAVASIDAVNKIGFVLREVIVVDNASTDGSLHGIDQLDVPVTVIRNDYNLGFAAACNQGAEIATGDYYLFLNPDTRLLDCSLAIPLAFMDLPENNHVGICGIQLVNENGKDCYSYAKFPTLKKFLLGAIGLSRLFSGDVRGSDGVVSEDDGVLIVDQVIGAFFIVRRNVFEQINGFDERFFVYFEEVDFAYRARELGWTSVCLTAAKCIHIGGGASSQAKADRLFYSLRSRILYSFKNFYLLSAICVLFIIFPLEFVSRSVLGLYNGSLISLKHVMQGYSKLLLSFPSILKVAYTSCKKKG